MALTGITMFRAREGIMDLDELIPQRADLNVEHFRLEDDTIALVYYKQTPVKPPRWAPFFNDIIDAGELRGQSSSAVITFQRNGIYYLVTFGHGRYLINLDCLEPSFGLRATLNSVDPDRIRSIDKKRVDTVSRLTREQLSRTARMGSFGLDIYQDLLSAVTGVPADERLGTRIYGKDAVGVQLDLQPRELGTLADLLEEVYARDAYRSKFPWVDRIGEVSDSMRIAALNRSLINALRAGDHHNFELNPPEIIDWSKAHGYVYRPGMDPSPDLELARYLEEVRPRAGITLAILKQDRVRLLDDDGQHLGGWSIYRCLSGEILYDGAVHVISDGRWYRVSTDFLQEVDASVGRLASQVVNLPPYLADDSDEGEYNTRAANSSGGRLVCLDQHFIAPRSWHDRIEFCDLYSADRKIVHVKRYSGSATLSHLFAQGAVSLRCLLTDPQFVADLDAKLPASHKFSGGSPKPEDCHVVFGIVGPKGRALRLPFFSRVALRNAAEMIENLGARVTYQEIPNRS